MTFSFEAEDRQFVTSTGDNATPDASTTPFDGAPVVSTGLVITPKAGDPDPRLFEIGDLYDLNWSGNSILDATVVRSDTAGEGGIVGFSGTDANGDPALVLWTPEFDLQGWYDSVGGQASFYTSDRQASYTHGYVCFAAEARIDTPQGPMSAENLNPGQKVLTVDAGPQVLRWVGRKTVSGRGQGAPVRFRSEQPGCADLRLSQQHRMMIADPQAEILFGHPEVLVPAKAMIGRPGIRLAPCAQVTYIHVLLDQHHILMSEGIACESLFFGQLAEQHVLIGDLPKRLEHCVRHGRAARPVLTYQEARVLVAALPQTAVIDAGRVA